jgi:MoaA/NifB/PqqE/SkfB family radical SAM enzyme
MPLWNNIAELMDYYIPPWPSVYWIDIIRECNLRCIMCPQSRGLTAKPARMAVPTFRHIIDEVCANRPLVKLYLSGEPLLHENLFEMIDYAADHGCATMIHTNAVALTEEMSRTILASRLSFLSFSFDGGVPAVYERLRPPAKFDEVRSNIRRHLDLRRSGGGPHTTVEVIRMQETDNLLQDFVQEWMAAGADDVHIADYLTWHGLVEDRRVESRAESGGYKPCAAPFRHGCILSDGTVVPCCLDVNGRMPLGHIARGRFHEIWAGNDYRRLRLGMLTGTLPPGCICQSCDNMFRDA